MALGLSRRALYQKSLTLHKIETYTIRLEFKIQIQRYRLQCATPVGSLHGPVDPVYECFFSDGGLWLCAAVVFVERSDQL